MRIITASFPAPLVKALGKDMSNFYKKYLYPFGISNSTEFTKATSQQVKRALSEKDPYTVAIGVYESSVALAYYNYINNKVICVKYVDGSTEPLRKTDLYSFYTLYLVKSSQEAAIALKYLEIDRFASKPGVENTRHKDSSFTQLDKSGYINRSAAAKRKDQFRKLVFENLDVRVSRQLSEAKECMISLLNSIKQKNITHEFNHKVYAASAAFNTILEIVESLNTSYFYRGLYDKTRAFEDATEDDLQAVATSIDLQGRIDQLKKAAR